jgi:putative heme-binding domain-containing protein
MACGSLIGFARRLPVVALAWLAVVPLSAGQTFTPDHPGQYTQADIAAGYEVYRTQCAHCHGPFGDLVSGVDLRRRVFRRSSSDEDLARVITSGVPGAGMPPVPLRPAELTGIVAFIRAGFDQTASVKVGDAARGRALFEGKGTCNNCHRVRGRGPRTAPDLSDIGLARTPAALQRSLLDPSSAMLPINRPVRIVMRDGRTISGRRLNEDTYTVQLIDAGERLLSIAKSDIRTLDVGTQSTMPSYRDRLTADELADVLGYLLTLREP